MDVADGDGSSGHGRDFTGAGRRRRSDREAPVIVGPAEAVVAGVDIGRGLSDHRSIPLEAPAPGPSKDRTIDQISPHPLWVGHHGDGSDARRLHELGIEAVVQVAAEEAPLSPPRGLMYHRFPLVDGSGNAPEVLVLAVVDGRVAGEAPGPDAGLLRDGAEPVAGDRGGGPGLDPPRVARGASGCWPIATRSTSRPASGARSGPLPGSRSASDLATLTGGLNPTGHPCGSSPPTNRLAHALGRPGGQDHGVSRRRPDRRGSAEDRRGDRREAPRAGDGRPGRVRVHARRQGRHLPEVRDRQPEPGPLAGRGRRRRRPGSSPGRPGSGDTDANVSKEEALRRERQRLRDTGITQVVRAEEADVAVIPLQGDLYLLRGRRPARTAHRDRRARDRPPA